MQHFQAKQYEKAADAFDVILKTTAPSAMTYYAALSNQSAGRLARAKALFQFIVKNFPDTTEAKYYQTALSNGSLEKSTGTKKSTSKDSATPQGESQNASTPSLQQPVTAKSEKQSAAGSKLDNSFIQIAEKTQYSEQVRLQILKGLMLIPEGVKTSLFNGGTRIIIDSDSSNMGSDPGFDAAGMFISRENAVHVAERASTRVLVDYTSEVILHEMGHAYDYSRSASSSPAYLEAYQAECDKLNPNDIKTLSYYVTTDFGGRPAKECFAELFKIICETGTQQAKTGGYAKRDQILANRFPNTLAAVKKLMD
jgi:tetratricopeptide (TPR) repeat protein